MIIRMKDTSTAERKLGTHFEFASGPRPFPKDRAGPIGQWSQNFRCPVLAVFLVSLPWLQISQQVLDLEFVAPDSGASYQCTSATRVEPSAMAGIIFRLRHYQVRPLPENGILA